MKNQIGQSAVEYLMTYGWMLLVVAIAGGAVFSMVGEQSIEAVTGFNSNELIVEDFGVGPSEGLMFSIQSPVQKLELQRARLTSSESGSVSYVLDQDLSGQEALSLPGIRPSSGSEEIQVELEYNSGSLENLSLSGTVQGALTVDESVDNQTIILDGLKGYWPLNSEYSEGGQTHDISGHHNHGEIIGPGFIDDEKFGEIMDFGGLGTGDHVQIEHSPSLNITDEITMAGWVKHSTDPDQSTDNEYRGIISKGTFDSYQYLIEDQGAFNPSVYVDEDRIGPRASISYFSIDTWHHIAYTHNPDGEGIIYIDGEKADTASHTQGRFDTNEKPLWIGGVLGDPWNGNIADIMVYNRALSEKEVLTLYENKR